MSMYNAGKKGSMCYTTSTMGKKPNATGAKVTAAAGKSSGTRREGDKSGAPAMGMGKGK